MKNTQKGFAPILVILLGLVVIGGGAYYFNQKSINNISDIKTETQKNNLDIERESTSTDSQSDIQIKKPTQNEEKKDILNLNIPSIIKQNRISKKELQLNHFVPYKHTDLCDMRDGSSVNENFTDYSNVITLYEGSLTQVVQWAFPHALTGDYLDASGNLKLQDGFIDKLTLNSRDVYKITTGVEGCGYYTYIIPYNNGAVVIRKNFTPPFSGNFTEKTVNEFKNINGVIKPEEADIIFNNILSQIIDNL